MFSPISLTVFVTPWPPSPASSRLLNRHWQYFLPWSYSHSPVLVYIPSEFSRTLRRCSFLSTRIFFLRNMLSIPLITASSIESFKREIDACVIPFLLFSTLNQPSTHKHTSQFECLVCYCIPLTELCGLLNSYNYAKALFHSWAAITFTTQHL